MDSFNKENIIISQDDISTPIKRKNSLPNISPLRDKSKSFMNMTPSNYYSNNNSMKILPDNDNDDNDVLLKDYHLLERQYANVIIQNNSLTADIQNLEMEILLKEKELLYKSSKINELVIENRQLDKNLQLEIRNNEQNYSNWTMLKQQYESKISHLNNKLHEERSYLNNIKYEANNDGESLTTIQILNKKLKSLQSDYELEKNSKMLIIDEFEMIKQNYLNLELNYNLLKNEFDKLHDETSSGSSIVVSGEKHQQDLSFQSDSSYGDDEVENIYSNNSSKNHHHHHHHHENTKITTLADELVEISDKYTYNQELIKLNFQIKSLNLQNEKLYSYIGYLLQQNSVNSNKEYSDEKLIKIAKRKLVNNKILRSVSSSARLHQSNRSEYSPPPPSQQHQLTVYPDHATDEEMSIFLNDCYDYQNKKIYNIKSTANLKKLHFTNHLSNNTHSSTITEEEDACHHTRIKLSILKNLIIGKNSNLQNLKLNLNKLLLNGVVEFIDDDNSDENNNDEHLITYDID